MSTRRAVMSLTLGLFAPLAMGCFSASNEDTGGGTKPTGGAADGGSSSSGGPSVGGNAGGSAGGSTAGGAASGGSTAGGAAAPELDLIDDMEGDSGSILTKDGRVGAWYTYNDGTAGAKQTPGVPFLPSPNDPPRAGSAQSARMTGSGFTSWGAGMGFNANDPGDGAGGSAKVAYDASSYVGIGFWARAGAGSTTAVRVNVSTKDTDPAGGVCAGAKCNDHFGKNLSLTTEWAFYEVRFSDIAQLGWGQPVAKFDASKLYAVQFQVGKGTTFDIAVDDIGFLKK